MPFTRVDMLKGKPAAYRKTISEVIYDGLIKVMKAPDGDRFTVIQEYEPGNFTYDQHFLGIERTNDVIIIQLYTTVGNTKEQKLGFFKLVADELHRKLGVRKEDVFINIVVCPVHEDWSFGNGEPWV